MKVNVKRELEKDLEEIWQATQRSINLTKAVLLLGVADYFKLGKKRMEDFLNYYNDFAKKHMEYEKDGIHVKKINEELKRFNTDFETLFGHETLKEAEENIKAKKRHQTISYADALSAQNKLKKHKEYVKQVIENERNKNG